MVLDLKLCRFEDAPWGFRLVGGADFEFPLTVVKVTEGSLAEKAGLQVNDVVVRINDTPTIDLSHNDAHQIIMHCGNNFFLGVSRHDSEQDKCQYQKDTESDVINTSETETGTKCRSYSTSPVKDGLYVTTEEQVAEIENSSNIVENNNLSDDEIAEMISGEAEVLKEHNVIGVNCYRIFPKAEICQSSEVFRQLNEEAVKTKVEAEKDKRKWTTFLQKPDRPIPKSKKEIEEEAKRVPYIVSITKQPKPKIAPDHIPTPPLPEPLVELDQAPVTERMNEFEELEELEELENQNEPPTDNEVPNLEPLNNNADEAKLDCSEPQEYTEAEATIERVLPHNQEQIENFENELPIKSDEELALERQLANVQQQLLALSSLPSTIQATLDAVTKQLSELLPTFRLQPVTDSRNNTDLPTNEEKDSLVETETQEETVREEIGNNMNNGEDNDNFIIETSCENLLSPNKQLEEAEGMVHTTQDFTVEQLEQLEQQTLEENQLKAQEEISYMKEKEEHVRMKEEQQKRSVGDRTPKRTKRPFGPLTPQERPLVLPGGRKWRRPKDAYNEEFIAEILSSQAELIVGTTLGSTFESPLLGYDQRVNFLKYQKPEKHIDLDRSEVYKVVHRLEKEPTRGISSRPEKVLAEADVRSRATPIFCG